MNSLELTQKIKNFALEEAGFDLVGISPAKLAATHEAALKTWIQNNFHGSMDYMARDPERRANPEKVLPSARSVISLAVNYFHPEDEKPEKTPAGKVAKYAYGKDYHKVIEKKLKRLSRFIMEISGSGVEVKSYVDTGPVLEKAFAAQGGLGFFGKNTNIITRNYGSWVFLASLLTNLELVADEPHTGSCGSCRICLDACPTEALLGNYQMDATKCISYLTIEDKTPAVAHNHASSKTGEWIFGCDICQDVCPYNFRAKTTRHAELYPDKKAGTWLSVEKINSMNQEEFQESFQGSPVKRPKLTGMRRNTELLKSL